MYHPKHGVVLLSPFKQFDGNRFYDPAYVRSYRTKLLSYVEGRKPGFGLQVQGEPTERTVITKHSQEMELSYTTQEGVQVHRTISVEADGSVKQATVLSTLRSTAVSVPIQLNLGVSLNRASYGQLTEGGPIPLPESLNLFQVAKDGSSFTLHNPNLKTRAGGTFSTDSVDFEGLIFDDGCQTFRGEPVQCQATARVKLKPGVPVKLTLSLRLQPEYSCALTIEKRLNSGTIQRPMWNVQDPAALNIIHGNLQYVLGNCTIPISNTSICVITDHVALPLGWNRDN